MFKITNIEYQKTIENKFIGYQIILRLYMNHKRNYFVMLLFVIIMFFCLFFVCFKILFDKDSVKELVINFDLIRLLRDDEKINDILSDKIGRASCRERV